MASEKKEKSPAGKPEGKKVAKADGGAKAKAEGKKPAAKADGAAKVAAPAGPRTMPRMQKVPSTSSEAR